mmetsp:Transcript_10815/g.16245  ORF Transcript_10815/g.16245 Transcript_10815/m.16245 type:complete len:235 (+) Transcript_10815:270-974(+)
MLLPQTSDSRWERLPVDLVGSAAAAGSAGQLRHGESGAGKDGEEEQQMQLHQKAWRLAVRRLDRGRKLLSGLPRGGQDGRILSGLLSCDGGHLFLRGDSLPDFCDLGVDVRVGGAGQMRIRALPRVAVMHPLREEAAGKRDSTPVFLSDGVQALTLHCSQVAGCFHGSGRQSGHKAGKLLRLGGRRGEAELNRFHQVLTLGDAPAIVVGGRPDRVGSSRDVVFDDDSRLPSTVG